MPRKVIFSVGLRVTLGLGHYRFRRGVQAKAGRISEMSFPLQADITRTKKQSLTSRIPPQNDISFPLLNDIK